MFVTNKSGKISAFYLVRKHCHRELNEEFVLYFPLLSLVSVLCSAIKNLFNPS